MSLSKSDKPALILIDIHKAFDDLAYWHGERNNAECVEFLGDESQGRMNTFTQSGG